MDIKEKVFLFSVLSKNAIFKTRRWYESIRSGKNRLTKDSAYNASLPNHFTPMLEEDKWEMGKEKFDQTIQEARDFIREKREIVEKAEQQLTGVN